MDVNLLREIVTVVSFSTFLGIVAYAMHPGNRERFDAAARMLDEEEEDGSPSPTLPQGGGSERGTRFVEGGQVLTSPSPTLPQGGGSNRWTRFVEWRQGR